MATISFCPMGDGKNQCNPGPDIELNLPNSLKAACSPGWTVNIPELPHNPN